MAVSIASTVADALVERVDRLVDHRQQDAVDDEGGEILRDRRWSCRACSTKALRGLEGRVVGGDAADQLDQLHHRHRVHEVHADEACSGRSVAAASRVIEIDEVLVAIMRVGLQRRAERR